MKGSVSYHDRRIVKDLGAGVSRSIQAYSEELMAVEVYFEQGSVGADHTHPHVQCSYVLSGRFAYHIEGELVELNPGDSIVVPANLVHGTTCLEKGTLLDIFTPMRKDFLA